MVRTQGGEGSRDIARIVVVRGTWPPAVPSGHFLQLLLKTAEVIDRIAKLKYNTSIPMITGRQLRAARALLDIDQQQLAELAGVSLATVQRMEAAGDSVRGTLETMTRLVSALEAAGVELIAEGQPCLGRGRGVRLKEPSP